MCNPRRVWVIPLNSLSSQQKWEGSLGEEKRGKLPVKHQFSSYLWKWIHSIWRSSWEGQDESVEWLSEIGSPDGSPSWARVTWLTWNAGHLCLLKDAEHHMVTNWNDTLWNLMMSLFCSRLWLCANPMMKCTWYFMNRSHVIVGLPVPLQSLAVREQRNESFWHIQGYLHKSKVFNV